MSRIAIMQGLRQEVKDALMTLHSAGIDAEECIDLLQTAFLYNSLQHLEECRMKLSAMRSNCDKAEKEIQALSREESGLRPYASVPAHFSQIAGNIESIVAQIDRKIREQVLFSDKAVDEVTFLLQRLIDLLRPTSDIILARNEILSKYVRESQSEVVKKALEYGTLHEERLIEGLCNPVGSALYLPILEGIKAIAWRAKKIAVELMA